MKRSLNKKAFSLIELLIVVSLLAILSVMLIIGVDKLRTNSKKQQTRLLLLNLQAMFSEFDASTHQSFGMGRINFNNMDAATQNKMLDYVYLASPGNVTSGTADATGPGVQYTRDFVYQMSQSPTVASAIGKMPAGSLMTFPGMNPPLTTPAWTNIYQQQTFHIFDTVSQPYTDSSGVNLTAYFRRTQVYGDLSGSNPYGTILYDTTDMAPPNSAFWLPTAPVPSTTLPLQTPVFLDAWGDPILFVMGGVLAPRAGTYSLSPDGRGNLVPAAGSGGMISNYGTSSVSIQVHSPDYRPFFASAGPDGDFSRGDDNMYSYEK